MDWFQLINEVDKKNLDLIRVEAYNKYVEKIGRNVIVYFSAWQQKQGIRANFSIDDNDLTGFMTAIHGLDKEKGLDLIIHTPGGEISAAQKIVEYLYNVFGDNFRVIVPHTAMSAGTMIACSASEIVMGKHSFLGPIDPQISGVAAHELKNVYNRIIDDLNNNKNLNYWSNFISSYPPYLIDELDNIEKHSKKLVKVWLSRNMMKEQSEEEVNKAVSYLSSPETHHIHNDCISVQNISNETSLKILKLEDDPVLQDCVLEIYHCFQILVSRTTVSKIIENNVGKRYVNVIN